MDKWSQEQLVRFVCSGGNARGRAFFAQHGWSLSDRGAIEQKYTSRAAEMYKAQLAKEVAAAMAGKAGVAPLSPKAGARPGGAASEFEDFPAAAPVLARPGAGAAAEEAQGPMVPAAAATAPAAASSLAAKRPSAVVGAKKPAGKLTGLGVKKLAVKARCSVPLLRVRRARRHTRAAAGALPAARGGASAARHGAAAAHARDGSCGEAGTRARTRGARSLSAG
jgi:hypothetical protein